MKPLDSGLNNWQHATNHNHLMKVQATAGNQAHDAPDTSGEVELTFFGSSAFRIKSPGGLTVMIDPWRNHPSHKWDWYFADFPLTQVDIGISTHAHFDHDALHRLDTSVALDRLIGTYQFSDVRITGLADKHATDASAALYDFRQIILDFDGIDITPPDNPRSWDNCIVTIETGGLRILHWGDNRHNPPEALWNALGHVDVLLIPVDNSQHVLGFAAIDAIIERLNPAIVIPHHYYSREVVQRQSTLQPADQWLAHRNGKIIETAGPHYLLHQKKINQNKHPVIVYFGDHIGFDTRSWRQAE